MAMDQSELRSIIADLARLQSAGLLDQAEADIWERIRAEAEDLKHAAPSKRLSIGLFAGRVTKLLGIPREDVLPAAEQVFLRTRRQIIVETISEYIVELDVPLAVKGEEIKEIVLHPTGDVLSVYSRDKCICQTKCTIELHSGGN